MKTYLRHRISNVIDIKELIALEFLDFEGKYRDYEEAHDFWELCYVVSGEIELVLEEERVRLSEDHLILITPNKRHAYFSRRGNENKAFVKELREMYKKGYFTTQELYGSYTSNLFVEQTDTRCYMCVGSSGGASY